MTKQNKYDFCPDCGTETMPSTPPGTPDWQRYMVYDDVWAAAGLRQSDGWFCIPCLEKRLNRPLTGADFPPLPINDPDSDDDTPRLKALKQATAQLHPTGDWLLKNRLA